MVKELKNTEWKSFSKAEYAVIDCYGENCFACVLLEPVFDAAADEPCRTRRRCRRHTE